MSLVGDLGQPSSEFLAFLASCAPVPAPKDIDGIDDADDAAVEEAA